MLIMMNSNMAGPGLSCQAGKIVDVPINLAKDLIKKGYAIDVSNEPHNKEFQKAMMPERPVDLAAGRVGKEKIVRGLADKLPPTPPVPEPSESDDNDNDSDTDADKTKAKKIFKKP